jgi:1,4-alpha-glucan branching enzyme
MFDTELFGHWWFEGPRFLASVLDRLDHDPELEAIAPAAELAAHPPRARAALHEGSWGEGGSHHMWLNADTLWVWPLVHEAERTFEELTAETVDAPPDPLLDRLARQATRELLLLASSDWPFLITTMAARGYASGRIREHARAFDRLARLAIRRARGGMISQAEERDLAALESADGPFAHLDRGAGAALEPARVARGRR